MKLEAWHFSLPIIPLLILLHLWAVPFTKVEESFNIQATHDFLAYGLSYNNAVAKIDAFYDHVRFPGAVPRTFIGALALAGISNPFVQIFDLDLPAQQMLARGVLGFLNAAALSFYIVGVRRAYGKETALWLIGLQASQFHITFYASRTLPNMFAFAMTTFALRFTLPEPAPSLAPIKRSKLALYMMTIVTIIFRSEVALLLLGHCLQTLIRSSSSINQVVSTIRNVLLPSVLTATVAGLALTVSIDTFIWRSPRLLWPEAAAFLSNVFPSPGSQGASAWGTSSWHWYLSSALPRLTSTPLLAILPIYIFHPTAIHRQVLALLLPAFVYLGLYSLLPHKETRFLFPILPTVNTALALVATHITQRTSRTTVYRFLAPILVFTTLLSLLASHLILLPLSALTYPGGHALGIVHAHAASAQPQPELHVHLTNLALQTGVTHFLEKPLRHSGQTRWVYDKSDNSSGKYTEKKFWNRFDYVVVEDEETVPVWPDMRFQTVGQVMGLGRPRLVTGARGGETDGVVMLLGRMYGENLLGRAAAGIYKVAKQLGIGVTRGRWLAWQHDPALVVLKRSHDVVEEVDTRGVQEAGMR